ncbi:MAG TPA: 30S ribosomal protein S16 [Thermodesulfobacteriaceae bacterium]|nr:30S ribosomal protein S16 [Thermodesulfobacteriaceae bacterium]
MAISIRLTRGGRKKKPFYRIVAANAESPRDGKFLEILGTYDPLKDPAEIRIDKSKLDKWLDRGAKPSDTVRSLMSKSVATQ